jgi:hypothetical protein
MDWKEHFQRVSKESEESVFGTVLGSHTVAELSDLVDAKDHDMKELSDAISHLSSVWLKSDPSAYNDFHQDYISLQSRYNAARSKASLAIAGGKAAWAPNSVIPVESEYQGILSALSPVVNTRTKGSLADLTARLQVVANKLGTSVQFTAPPQPTATDADLLGYKKTDSITRAMPNWVKRAVGTVVPEWVPDTADKPKYDPVPNYVLYIVGAVAVLVIGSVALGPTVGTAYLTRRSS